MEGPLFGGFYCMSSKMFRFTNVCPKKLCPFKCMTHSANFLGLKAQKRSFTLNNAAF